MRFNERIDTAHAISQGYDAISKNEIQPRFIDRIPKRAHNSKDNYRSGTTEHYSILTINQAGTATVNFTMEPYAKLQAEELLLVCQPSAVTENIPPYFDVRNDDGQERVINNKNDSTLDSKYFTNFVWKSWSCKASQSEQNGQTKEFTRVITERDVNTDAADYNSLKRIVYSPSDNAWFDLLSSADHTYKIKLEGIRYYQHNAALKDPIDFDGYSILEDAQSSHTNNIWKSGTKTLEELPSSKVAVYTDHTTEVYYDLNEGRSYMLHLPGDQASAAWNAKKILRIGTKWKEPITLTAGSSNMQCHEEEAAKFSSDDSSNFLHTLVQIYSQGNNEEVEDTLHHGNTRVWICSDNEKTILRVKNNFILESTNVENIKTIEYFDGVAVFSGELDGRDVFEIAEVKYLNFTDKNVVKYVGPLVFPSNSSSDVLGLYPIQCVQMTEDEVSRFEMKVSNEGFKDQLLPKVVLLKRNEGVKEILPTKLDKEKLKIEFDFSQRLWNCSEVAAPTGRTAEILYRVRSRMRVKAAEISRFYHRDEVEVMLENGEAEIEHIMYLSENSTTYRAVQFEGLVILPRDEMTDRVTFKYHLDQPILQFEAFNATQGITIEVTSQWNQEIENIDGEIVTCEMHKDSPVRPATHKETEILVNDNSDTENPTHTWKVMDSTLKTFFETKIYEEWSCKNKDYEFSRVVNKLITTRDDIRVYYPAGVKVGVLSIYNNRKALQIAQVKFFKELQPIKYIGKLRLVRKTVVGAEEFLGSFHNDVETRSLNSEPSGNITWTLDSMRFCASNDIGETNTSTDRIKFNVQQGHLQTYYIPENKKSNRIFQLGRFWTKELNPTGEMMKCYAFKWDEHKPRYTPRVAEYIDQQLYSLTRDEFDELFTINDIKVWLCTNKEDEFLKVYTVYESTTLPFAVRYTDGIKVEMQNRGEGAADKKALVIHETVYLDTMSSLVYKYDATNPLKEYVVESA
ncbi:uncharacterized protein LOC111047365 isoform X3 [Nilaparvata lugens]|uniref:uncharacterized protein LOC111047365 isoform X3 n=1 Tax=Nilaparvata lugens TaxID=108931 RepID=UPI00193DCCC9|nr:uncharacterized protein LOC111047365 isoform X3 [Nilaparvata lugens]